MADNNQSDSTINSSNELRQYKLLGLDTTIFENLDPNTKIPENHRFDGSTDIGKAYLRAAEIFYNTKNEESLANKFNQAISSARKRVNLKSTTPNTPWDKTLQKEGLEELSKKVETQSVKTLFHEVNFENKFSHISDEAKVALLYMQTLNRYTDKRENDKLNQATETLKDVVSGFTDNLEKLKKNDESTNDKITNDKITNDKNPNGESTNDKNPNDKTTDGEIIKNIYNSAIGAKDFAIKFAKDNKDNRAIKFATDAELFAGGGGPKSTEASRALANTGKFLWGGLIAAGKGMWRFASDAQEKDAFGGAGRMGTQILAGLFAFLTVKKMVGVTKIPLKGLIKYVLGAVAAVVSVSLVSALQNKGEGVVQGSDKHININKNGPVPVRKQDHNGQELKKTFLNRGEKDLLKTALKFEKNNLVDPNNIAAQGNPNYVPRSNDLLKIFAQSGNGEHLPTNLAGDGQDLNNANFIPTVPNGQTTHGDNLTFPDRVFSGFQPSFPA